MMNRRFFAWWGGAVGGSLLAGALLADSMTVMPEPRTSMPPSGFSRQPTESIEAVPLPAVPGYPFRVGEKFTFAIKYQFITAGTATLEVKPGEPMGGRETLLLESMAKSNGFFDKIFRVRDYNGSTVDKASLASLQFHQNLQEGGFKVIRTTRFDYEKRQLFYEKQYKGKTTLRTGPVEQPLQDILSSFYFTRTFPLERGKEYEMVAGSDDATYILKVKVGPKLQKISVPAGKFMCVKVEPKIIGDAIFKAADGKMTIWITNDEHHMPVLIRSKAFIGSFDAELLNYRFSSEEDVKGPQEPEKPHEDPLPPYLPDPA